MTIEEKKERIIELRKAGATYEQISDALGYPKNSHGGGFVSKGGNHSWNNVQLACRSCNSKKGNRV